MNRENEYRGKIKENQQGNELDWVYGDLVRELSTGRCFIMDLAKFDNGTKLVDVMIEIDPKTKGQYTGKNDKNGKKIYGGSIVKFKEWSKGEFCWIGEVVYDYGSMYVIRGNPNKECGNPFEIQLSRLDSERIEVMGNIHDDKEEINNVD